MAQVVFRSKYAAYRIHFDPKRFGLMTSPDENDYEMDANGRVVTAIVPDPNDGTKVVNAPIMRKVVRPAAQFQDSMIVLDDSKPMQSMMIADLRKIIKGDVLDNQRQKFCRADELWEEEASVTALVNQMAGEIILELPETFTEEDLALFKEIEKYFHNPIPRPALNNVMAMFDRALTRFRVRGLLSPSVERAVKQLRPRIIDLAYALSDAATQLGMQIPLELEIQSRSNGDTEGQSQPSV